MVELKQLNEANPADAQLFEELSREAFVNFIGSAAHALVDERRKEKRRKEKEKAGESSG